MTLICYNQQCQLIEAEFIMETITLQVDPEIAEAYREAEPEKQKNALIVCNLILEELLKDTSDKSVIGRRRYSE